MQIMGDLILDELEYVLEVEYQMNTNLWGNIQTQCYFYWHISQFTQ